MSDSIVVIGSSNVDLIMQLPRLPRPGETISGGVFTQTYGGKGANQAVGAARSGGQVTFVSCLGADGFAPDFIQNFQQDSIRTEYVFQIPEAATGTALIMIDAKGENCISVAPGANHLLTRSHLRQAKEAIEQAAVILLQCELHPATLRQVIELGDELNKPILLNLAPAQALEDDYLSKLHWLIVNESEAAMLTQMSVENMKDVQAAADLLIKKVGGGVIITLGAKGSYIVEKTHRQLVPAFSVNAVDTTAAGDVYCGSLATALVEGKSTQEAVRFASAAAAIAVTRLGAQASAPTRAEIDQFLTEHTS
ncbi:MAG: ribokinase [Bacteroidota bacterium]